MKTLSITLISAALLFAASCSDGGKKTAEGTLYGAEFKPEKVIAVSELDAIAQSGKEEPVMVTGKVNSVCQSEGCWLKLEKEGGEPVHVEVKGHNAFTLPKDCSGKTAIINGTVKVEEISVEEQKHLAKDAGKSQEEIDKITTPEKETVIEATGVIIK